MIPPPHSHSDVDRQLERDSAARDLEAVFTGLFTISFYKQITYRGGTYAILYCKPTHALASAQLIEREVLTVIAPFTDLQARTLTIIKRELRDSESRLDPSLVIVGHHDRRGDAKLRTWGAENRLKLVSVYRQRRYATPPEDARRSLIQELFSLDPFQVTGPVASDQDFFGRGVQAQDLLRQLQNGRIHSLFGIRKVGKTSLLNRVIRLAREARNPAVAMVDCSLRDFYSLSADQALRVVQTAIVEASASGYARIDVGLIARSSGRKRGLPPLWDRVTAKSVLVVFDEVDYVTPFSPISNQWRREFNPFWREFRALVQESQRHDVQLSVLVSGVSSKAFRTASFEGVENSALHFIPEEYLSPFARQASHSMLKELGKRCGLQFDKDARDYVADSCGDFPFWMRMAGSFLHNRLPMEHRPITLSRDMVAPIIDDFVTTEGADIARVALENFRRVYPEMFASLTQAAADRIPAATARPLERYGLATKQASSLVVHPGMVRAGLEHASGIEDTLSLPIPDPSAQVEIFEDSQWAEDLASIGRRRNILERRLRDLIRFVLKANLPKAGDAWQVAVLKSLPEKRRNELQGFAPDALMQKLYWLELRAVLVREWKYFEHIVGDKNRLQLAMDILNERPDAHAKDLDPADLALHRRELAWLEERILT